MRKKISIVFITIISYFVIVCMMYNFFVSHASFVKTCNFTIFNDNNSNGVVRTQIKFWHDAPRFTLLCRVFQGATLEIWNVFLISHLLFWPRTKWPQSDIVLVWDNESLHDHHMANLLSHIPPYPNVMFENRPLSGTLCSNWRSEGYSRQQYSNFYSDLYTDADYIGIVDSDSSFSTPVVPEDLFDNFNGTKRPRLIGYNGCCTPWNKCVEPSIGKPGVIEFMVVIGFPVIVKRSHFEDIRNHIIQHMKVKSFEEAFHQICSLHPSSYSQFALIGNYLWWFKRDEYSWHIIDGPTSHHPVLGRSRLSDDSNLLISNRPKVGVMKHISPFNFENAGFLYLLGDYLCVASNWSAGDCATYRRQDTETSIHAGLLTDWQYNIGGWTERGWPIAPNIVHGPLLEVPWKSETAPNWQNTILEHYRNVLKRGGQWPNNKNHKDF